MPGGPNPLHQNKWTSRLLSTPDVIKGQLPTIPGAVNSAELTGQARPEYRWNVNDDAREKGVSAKFGDC